MVFATYFYLLIQIQKNFNYPWGAIELYPMWLYYESTHEYENIKKLK